MSYARVMGLIGGNMIVLCLGWLLLKWVRQRGVRKARRELGEEHIPEGDLQLEENSKVERKGSVSSGEDEDPGQEVQLTFTLSNPPDSQLEE